MKRPWSRLSPLYFRSRTVVVATYVYHARAEAQEEHPVLPVLRAELGRRHVHGGLADGVERADVEVVLCGQLGVAQAARDDDNLLNLTLQDEGHEQVVEMDVGVHVGLHAFLQFLLQGRWGLRAVFLRRRRRVSVITAQ